MDSYQRRVTIDGDHPALPGHFPDHPVVPGVVILDEVVASLAEAGFEGEPAGLNGVKFLRPLFPGEAMTVELVAGEPGQVVFTCTARGGETIAQGRLQLRGGA